MSSLLIDAGLFPALASYRSLFAVRVALLRARLARWRRAGAERQQLLAMDDRALRDIGLTRYDALVTAAGRDGAQADRAAR